MLLARSRIAILSASCPRLIPRRAHSNVELFVGREDHRQGLWGVGSMTAFGNARAAERWFIKASMPFRCSQRSPMASCRKSLRSAPTGSCLARRSASAACFSSPDSLRSICCPKQTGDRHGGAARLALKFRRPLPTTSIVLPHGRGHSQPLRYEQAEVKFS